MNVNQALSICQHSLARSALLFLGRWLCRLSPWKTARLRRAIDLLQVTQPGRPRGPRGLGLKCCSCRPAHVQGRTQGDEKHPFCRNRPFHPSLLNPQTATSLGGPTSQAVPAFGRRRVWPLQRPAEMLLIPQAVYCAGPALVRLQGGV